MDGQLLYPEQKMGAGRGNHVPDWFNPADARLPLSRDTLATEGTLFLMRREYFLAWHGRRR